MVSFVPLHQETEQLRKELSELKNEHNMSIEKLRLEVQDLTEKCVQLEEENACNASSSLELDVLRKKYANLELTVTSFEDELTQTKAEAEEVATTLRKRCRLLEAELEDEAARYREDTEALDARCRGLEDEKRNAGDIEMLRQKCAEWECTAAHQREEISLLGVVKENYDEIQAKCKRYEELNVELDGQLTVLKEEIEGLRIKCTALESLANASEREIVLSKETADVELKDLREKCSRLQGAAFEAEEELSKAKEAAEELEIYKRKCTKLEETCTAYEEELGHVKSDAEEAFTLRRKCSQLQIDLEDEISKHQEDVEYLNAKLSKLENDKSESDCSTDVHLAKAKAEHEEEIATLRERCTRLKDANGELEEELLKSKEAEEELEGYKRKCSKLEERICAFEEELEQAKADVETVFSLKKKVSRLEEDLEIEAKKYQEDVDALTEKLNTLERERHTVDSEEVATLRARCAQFEEKASDLHEQLNSSTEDLEDLRRKFSRTETLAVALEEELTRARVANDDEVKKLQSKCSLLQDSNAEVEAELSQAQQVIQQEEAPEHTHSFLPKQEAEANRRKCLKHEEALSAFEEEINQLKADAEEAISLRKKCSRLDDVCAELEEKVQSTSEEAVRWQKKYSRQESTVSALEDELREAQEKIVEFETLQRKAARLEDTCSKLQEELDLHQSSDEHKADSELELAKRRASKLEEDINVLEETLQRAKAEVVEMEALRKKCALLEQKAEEETASASSAASMGGEITALRKKCSALEEEKVETLEAKEREIKTLQKKCQLMEDAAFALEQELANNKKNTGDEMTELPPFEINPGGQEWKTYTIMKPELSFVNFGAFPQLEALIEQFDQHEAMMRNAIVGEEETELNIIKFFGKLQIISHRKHSIVMKEYVDRKNVETQQLQAWNTFEAHKQCVLQRSFASQMQKKVQSARKK